MREEDRVDPAHRRARDDIDDGLELLRAANFGKQIMIDTLAVRERLRLARMVGEAGAQELPDLPGNAVHVNGEADSAITYQRRPK